MTRIVGKKLLVIFFILISSIAHAETSDDLIKTIESNRFILNYENELVKGVGYTKLINESLKANIFMFGENHATKEIALLADQIFKDLTKGTPRVLVTEVGPIAADKMQSLIRTNEYEEHMSSGLNLQTIPFFAFKEEVPILKSACEQDLQVENCIVGVDQEFIASASLIHDYLKNTLDKDDPAHTQLSSFNRWSWINPFLVGQGDGKAINALSKSLKENSSETISKLAEQLELTFKIYKNQMGGDSKWANEARESLMMQNFVEQLDGNNPFDMFFKFGAYHTMKGESVTVDEAFGARVDKWAKEKGLTTLNVFIDGYKGNSRDPLLGFEKDKSHFTNWSKSPFADFIPEKGAALFDLRALRPHANSELFSKRQKMMINNYDYFLIFSTVSAATFLEGTLITRTYLGLILTVILTLIISIIYWIVKLIRRRKKLKNKAVH